MEICPSQPNSASYGGPCVLFVQEVHSLAEREGGAVIGPKHSGFATHLVLRSRRAGAG